MSFNRLKSVLRGTGAWAYLKYYKRRFFPSKSQQEEDKLFPNRLSFYKDFVRTGSLCFDVGANIGNRTEVFLALKARVVAVEPQRDCAQLLKLRFGNRISLEEMALGEAEGEGLLYVSETSEISSLSSDWIDSVSKSRFKGKTWGKGKQVRLGTLDKIIEKHGVPDFCKIDVEGYEAEVFKGLSHPIPVISFEYTIPEKLDNISNCFTRLREIGNFVCNYTIGENMKLALVDWISDGELMDHMNKLSSDMVFGDIYVKFDRTSR